MKTGIPGRLLALLLAVVMVIAMLPLSAVAEEPTATYTKVTAAPKDNDWSGEYLVVYEKSDTAGYVFDSTLTSPDAEGNRKELAITTSSSKKSIKAPENLAVTIDKEGYIKTSSGLYIFGNTSSNSLNTSPARDKAVANTFALNDDGSVNIVSNTKYFRYNDRNGKGHQRFRYYKSASSEEAITLYKKVDVPTRESGIVTDLTTLQEGDKVVIFNPK